jgi:hypothetical protein
MATASNVAQTDGAGGMKYEIQLRQKSGAYSVILDPAFRTRCVAVASSGASRRTVAATVGTAETNLRRWINRGEAYPDHEPYGSFSRDYRMAERGLAASAGETVSMKAQLLNEQMRRRLEWEKREGVGPKPVKPKKPGKGASLQERIEHARAVEAYPAELADWEARKALDVTPPPTPDVAEMLWLEKVRISRHPEDYGTSKHRKPDTPYDGLEFLNETAMDRAQLAALFSDPPEEMRLALQDAARHVYAILMEGGFDPAAPLPVTEGDDDE